MNAAGWAAAAIVLAGILTAWVEPSTSGLMHAGLLLACAAGALAAAIRRIDIPIHPAALLPLACAAWGIAQLALGWTVYSYETWNSVMAWVTRAAVFSVAYTGATNPDRLKTAIVWFGGAFSVLALLQWYTGGGTVFWAFETSYQAEGAGTFGNRDQYAAFIELLLPVALSACLAGRGPRLLAMACAGVMFASVIASGSRAGAIVISVEAMVFIAVAITRERRNLRRAGLLAAVLTVCTLVGGWTYVWERFSSDDPFAFRREMLVATAGMIRERPLTGFGLGTWPAVYPAFAVFDPPGVYMNHAHNDWAEWTAEGGAPFLVLMIAFACAAVLRLRINLWALGVPAVLAHALVDFPLQKPALACALFFIAGVAMRATAPFGRSAPETSSALTAAGEPCSSGSRLR